LSRENKRYKINFETKETNQISISTILTVFNKNYCQILFVDKICYFYESFFVILKEKKRKIMLFIANYFLYIKNILQEIVI